MSVCVSVHMKYHSQQTKQQNMMSHLFWEPLLTSLPPTRGYVCVCIIFSADVVSERETHSKTVDSDGVSMNIRTGDFSKCDIEKEGEIVALFTRAPLRACDSSVFMLTFCLGMCDWCTFSANLCFHIHTWNALALNIGWEFARARPLYLFLFQSPALTLWMSLSFESQCLPSHFSCELWNVIRLTCIFSLHFFII